MARETTHEFPAAQVFMDLAVNRPVRTRSKGDGVNLHVCFDKKLKQNALNNFLMSHTPYRCSLGRPKEILNAKRRTKAASSEVSLPKIPESLTGRTLTPEDGPRQQTTKRLIDLESEEEEEQCNFLSCKSVKEDHSHSAARPTIDSRKESRSRRLPLILKKGNCPSCLRTDNKSEKSLDKLPNGQDYSPAKTGSDLGNENKSSRDKESTTVMEDGARITVIQQRLFIEVFMPRTS
ncbi:uncharacterized protein LOC110041007 [Orbicella faveolata]|uniref:uncharacterized protein LOC110041007 n=1 Tax=Orbicella faveolata TaxID=48498 RepID=UPI0009E40118|nr:uncharacterized protein LOC110041007 [Orbicella faveolata]